MLAQLGIIFAPKLFKEKPENFKNKFGIIGFMVQIAVWLLRRANKFARY